MILGDWSWLWWAETFAAYNRRWTAVMTHFKIELSRLLNLIPFSRYREYNLENRLSVIFLLTGFLLSGVAFVLTLIFQLPAWMNSFNLACMIMCLVLPIIMPGRLFQATIIALLFVAFIYFPFVFFTNAGNYGTAPIYFVMIMVYFAFYLKGARLIAASAILLMYYTLIMIFGYMYPELVVPYPDEISKMIDLCVAFISVSIVMSIIAGTTFSGYKEERDQVAELMSKLERRNKELELLSNKDPLTGVYNRRYFSMVLEKELILAGQNQERFHLLMIDIDHFKKINDTHGHLYGDEILKLVAKGIDSSVRGHDVVARFGGEEFVVLLSAAEKHDGYHIAERIRRSIDQMEYRNARQVSVSIGVTKYIKGDSITDIVKRVDELLYAAKKNGRNRIESDL